MDLPETFFASQVFLKYWHVDQLNMCLEKFISDLRLIQTTIQMYLARRKFLDMMQYITYCKDQVFSLGNIAAKTGDQLFHIMVSANDLDKHHYRKKVRVIKYFFFLLHVLFTDTKSFQSLIE